MDLLVVTHALITNLTRPHEHHGATPKGYVPDLSAYRNWLAVEGLLCPLPGFAVMP
jgi:hypothetical protein